MIGSGLKKYAQEMGLTVESGVAYGWLKDCYVALSEGAGYKRLSIYIGCHHAPEEAVAAVEGETPAHLQAADRVADLILEKAGDPKAYRLMPNGKGMPAVVLAQGGSVLHVNFFDNPGTLKCVRAFVEDVLPLVAPMTTPKVCEKCGEALDTASLPVRLSDCAVVPMHSHCADEITKALDTIKESKSPAFPLLPMLGALVGALIGAIVWAVVGAMGYIASLAGLLIAFLSSKGYDLLGGKPGKIKLCTLIVCVILAVIVGNIAANLYLIHDTYTELLAESGISEALLPEKQFFEEMIPNLLKDNEFISAFVKDTLLGFLFAGLGCFGILRSSTAKPEDALKIKVLSGRI